MKTTGTMLLAVLLSLGFAVTSFAAVLGSAHDMGIFTGGSTSICAYCHTPHNAVVDDDFDYNPLWSRVDTLNTFSNYTSVTMQGDTSDPMQGPSRLCMGCHDGSIAVDTLGNTIGTNFVTGNSNLGTDLSNDHPIGFDYTDVADNDTEIKDEVGIEFAGGELLTNVLFGGNIMTCSTCHDVHNGANVQGGKLLYAGQGNGVLCITCHDK